MKKKLNDMLCPYFFIIAKYQIKRKRNCRFENGGFFFNFHFVIPNIMIKFALG